jgi:hypothetical protein
MFSTFNKQQVFGNLRFEILVISFFNFVFFQFSQTNQTIRRFQFRL